MKIYGVICCGASLASSEGGVGSKDYTKFAKEEENQIEMWKWLRRENMTVLHAMVLREEFEKNFPKGSAARAWSLRKEKVTFT